MSFTIWFQTCWRDNKHKQNMRDKRLVLFDDQIIWKFDANGGWFCDIVIVLLFGWSFYIIQIYCNEAIFIGVQSQQLDVLQLVLILSQTLDVSPLSRKKASPMNPVTAFSYPTVLNLTLLISFNSISEYWELHFMKNIMIQHV